MIGEDEMMIEIHKAGAEILKTNMYRESVVSVSRWIL